MNKTIRVLGIDAAFVNVGLALAEVTIDRSVSQINVQDLRLVRTEADKDSKKKVRKNSDDLRRAREVVRAIRYAIQEWDVHMVAVEVPTGAQSARAAWSLGMAVGILASIDVPTIEVLPREVKLVTGERHADKDMMIEWAIANHPSAPWSYRTLAGKQVQVSSTNEHLADAVAAIHAGTRTEEFKRMAMMFAQFRAV